MRNFVKPERPDKRLRELRKEFRDLGKADPGPQTARRWAAFTRQAHAERMLNKVMHAAQQCLLGDPEAPAMLVAAYTDDHEDVEERLRALSELANLGRWIGRDDLVDTARGLAGDDARAWCAAAEGATRERRLRDLESMFDRDFARSIETQTGD